MAVKKKQISSTRKKLKRVGPKKEEEVVIKLGEKPLVQESEEKKVKELKEEEEIIEEKEEPEIEEEEVIDLGEFEEEPELEEELEEESEEEPGEEEVVVISIGKPPEKEELPEKEKKLEPKAEEEEVVEVEPEKKKAKPKKEKDVNKRKKIAAGIIIIILIIGSIGTYLFFIQNQKPVAKLWVSTDTAYEGQLIKFDASNSTDDKGIIEYIWDFGDEIYSEKKNNAKDGRFDGKTTHVYSDEDTYTVELEVRDKEDKADSTKASIIITELEVTIPEEKIGDEHTYDVNGSVDVEDPDGLWTGSTDTGTGSGSFTLKKVHVDYDEGEMISKIEGNTPKEDGFGETHQTLQRYNYEYVELSGTISGTVTTQTPSGPVNVPLNDVPIQDGELEVTEISYIDLTTNKTIFSDVESNFLLPAGEYEVSSYDHLRSYSNLREKPAVLRVEDLSPDRTFSKDPEGADPHIKRVGDIVYYWMVVKADNVKGHPSLGIKVGIDDTTKTENDIEDFEMWLWITNGISLPIKTSIYAKYVSEGTTATIYYHNEIREDGFEGGAINIPYGTCSASTPEGHYYLKDPDLEFLNWNSGDYLPQMGSDSINFEFTPEEAINHAISSSGSFSSYLTNNPGAYVIDGYYNESGDNPVWNLTFGEKGDKSGQYIVVEYDGGSYNLKKREEVDIPELWNYTSDFDSVLSISASKHVFERDEKVNSTAFSGGNIRFYDGLVFGMRTNMIYPTISLTISFSFERTGYSYYLYKEDGSLMAGVDAINGQMIYMWEHTGDDILSALL